MSIEIERVDVEAIVALRQLHREEMDCQIIHDSLHRRGMTHPYLIRTNGETAGYGTVVGYGDEPKETVDEFFLHPPHRAKARALFAEFVSASGATRIQAQSTDPLLTLMLFDFADRIERDRILFHDGFTSQLSIPGATYRPITEEDRVNLNPRNPEDVGDWAIESGGEVVATGGILFHYNPPYGDLYMEVREPFRRCGFGSYLVQELKRTCYEMDKVPAARCDVENEASRATLQKAGMLPCGFMLNGVIA